MKKYILILFGVLLFVAPSAHAADVKTNEKVVVGKQDVVEDDIYAIGQSVQIDGTVKGDIVAFSGQVIVTGTIEGDLTVFSGDVTLGGTVGDDIRVFGGTIRTSGEVADEALVFGGDVFFDKDSKVFGDLIAFGGKVTLDGSIDGHVRTGGGDIRIGGPISSNVDVQQAQTLTLEDDAIIGGDLVYTTDNTLSTTEQSRVQGKSTHNEPPARRSQQWVVSSFQGLVVHQLFWHLFLAASSVLTVLALLWLFPRTFERIVPALVPENMWRHLGFGILAFVLTPLVVILLAITIIGIPLALLSLLLYLILWMIATLPAAYVLGEYVMKKLKRQQNLRGVMTLGIILVQGVFFLFALVPIIGPLLSFLIKIWGLGALVASLCSSHKSAS